MFLEAAMHIVQSIMVCYGISMELPVIHCLLVLSGWIVPIIFEGGNSGTKAKDCGRGGMGNCIGRNGVQ